MGRFRFITNLFFTLLLLIFPACLQSQDTGVFQKNITAEDGTDIVIHFYVPDSYDADKEYPLVIGLPPGTTSGVFFRDMLYFKISDKDLIMACPDETYKDHEIIAHTIKYCQQEYNIDGENIVLSGYSAGGSSAFAWGYDKADIIKGILGVAPAIGGFDYSYVHNRPFALICGDKDALISVSRTLNENINLNKGSCILIEKPNVGHSGDYFMMSEFRDDWWQCYEFIQNFQPLPQVELIAPKNNSSGIKQPVQLKWNKFDSFGEYEIEVYNYSEKILTDTINNTGYTIDGFAGNYKLSWLVRPLTESDDLMWSQKWNFTTNILPIENKVELDFPADGAEKQAIVAQLCWNVESQAEFYHLQLSEDEFQTFTIDNDSLEAKQGYIRYQHHEYYKEGTKYWWRVRAGNSLGWGPWSDARTFTTMIYNSVDDDISGQPSLILYPNPAGDYLIIDTDNINLNNSIVTIVDYPGKIIHWDVSTNGQINISELPAGYYTLLLYTGKNIIRKEFVICR